MTSLNANRVSEFDRLMHQKKLMTRVMMQRKPTVMIVDAADDSDKDFSSEGISSSGSGETREELSEKSSKFEMDDHMSMSSLEDDHRLAAASTEKKKELNKTSDNIQENLQQSLEGAVKSLAGVLVDQQSIKKKTNKRVRLLR